MGILNPSFEDAGAQPGLAEHWTLTTSVAGQRIAGFGPAPEDAWEGFERWFELLTEFEPGSLALALFDPLAEGHEDFEEAWSNDQAFAWLWAAVTSQAALFNGAGNADEDFENAWRPATTI